MSKLAEIRVEIGLRLCHMRLDPETRLDKYHDKGKIICHVPSQGGAGPSDVK